MDVSAIHLMCCFMTLCVTDPIWGVCCYSYTLVGVFSVILCNVVGVNISNCATILLKKVVHAVPNFLGNSTRAAAIAWLLQAILEL